MYGTTQTVAVFADGTRWTASDLKQKAMQATSADDAILGTSGDDVLRGLGGRDTLFGGDGNDTYLVGIGDSLEEIQDMSGNNTVRFIGTIVSTDINLSRDNWALKLQVANSDTVVSLSSVFSSFTQGMTYVEFSDGTRWNVSDLVHRLGQASEGNDTLYGSEQSDVISGWGGNDQISGGSGDDTLRGNSGDDTLNGDNGNDVFLFGRGDGVDRIRGTADEGETETLRFDATLAAGDIKVHRDVFNLYLSVQGTGDQVIFENWALLASERKGKFVQFADGTIWDEVRLLELSSAKVATDGNDFIDGTAGNDQLKGLGGDDKLAGFAGNDEIDGGSGRDTIQGGAGDDVMSGGVGDDIIFDTEGNDIYYYQLGDGYDSITDLTGDIDILRFGEGIKAEHISAQRDSYSLVLKLDGVKIFSIDSWFRSESSRIERVEFSDGTVWLAAELTVRASNATEGPDKLKGTDGPDLINGLGGDDEIESGEGNDTLYGGDGNDEMDGDYGDDLLYGGNGNDTLDGYRDNDTLYGDTGDDELDGNRGNDSLDGGDGNDSLKGGDGLDTLLGGDGDDTLDGGANADTLAGGAGNDEYHIGLGNDLIVEEAGKGIDHVRSTTSYTLTGNVEVLTLDSNAGLNGSGNSGNNLLLGGAGVNVLIGEEGNDILQGADGDDQLSDAMGHNVLTGDAGSDLLTVVSGHAFVTGGVGDDTLSLSGKGNVLAFNRGDGADNVLTTSAGMTISLGKIAYSDVILQKVGDGLILKFGQNDQITLADWYQGSGAAQESRLQMVIDGTPDYDAASVNLMVNQRVQLFDLDALVARFDAMRAAHMGLSSWSASAELRALRIQGGDKAAVGGDIALQYSSQGNLATMSYTAAQRVLGEDDFGEAWQAQLVGIPLKDETPSLI
ncbi:hypothetical protein ACZ75_17810 [Massilia sp. NR 4-1]|nr:hypothetical protein ACZ75_17810 [Massilia sp. NR 4-1]